MKDVVRADTATERKTAKRRGRASPRSHITVRSELRALEVLEYFSRVSDEGRVTEVARALGHPQSSTSRLLATLAEAGYLIHDRRRRTYCPSARVALLSIRTMSRLFGEGNLLNMLDDLAQHTSGPVLLTARNEHKLNVVHVMLPQGVPSLCYDVGNEAPLVVSASGRLILAKYSDFFIQSLVRRYNSEVPANERIDPKRFVEEVAEVRERGYIVYPLSDAQAMLAKQCRLTLEGGQAQCCLAKGGPYLAAPVHTDLGDDVAVLVSLPAGTTEAEYPAHAAKVQAVIARHMEAAGMAPPPSPDQDA